MKKLLYIVLFFINSVSGQLTKTTSNTDIDQKGEILQTVLKTLKLKHISPKKIDDNFSKNLFKTYFKELDAYGYFFLQSDIDEFKKFELQLDNQILKNDFTFFDLTRERFMQRLAICKEIYTKLLKNKLDFEPTVFPINNKKRDGINDFRKSNDELIEYYRNGLKTIVLDLAKENYKANMFRADFLKYVSELQETKVPNLLEKSVYNIDNITLDYVFQKYLNAICMQFDSHTKYYLPYQRDENIIKESGKIEGIGISMAVVNDFVVIDKISAGGPAFYTNKLQVGDVVLKIAQENDEPVNIVNFNLYEVAKLTRGKSGTNVKLTIKKTDGKIITVPIRRGVVSNNDSYIKSCTVVKNNILFGVISFSRFYNELDDQEKRNVIDDFTSELAILSKSNVQGLVLDLRNNNGGTIEQAVKILNNFVTKRKISKFKNNLQKTVTTQTENAAPNFGKQIVLLVNAKTASAAEMLASAFQELNLGVILGEKTSGNATIKELIDLNEFKTNKTTVKDFGAIQVSTQKFYKLNGSSVQKTGVNPDLNFSTLNKAQRESDLDNPLPADMVKSTLFKPLKKAGFYTAVIKKSQERLDRSEMYKLIKNDNLEDQFNEVNNNNPQSFQKTLDNLLQVKENSLLYKYNNNLDFLPTTNDEKTFKKREFLLQKRKQWYKSLSQDFMIEESVNILCDMQALK